MIERDPTVAARARYDLLIVGGGIYGVCLAMESARRGLRPALVERDDFGGATSWNSLRIVHGGLRYLQSLDLRRFHESVGERRWLLRHFPDLVHPLACLMPLYGEGLKRTGIFRVALAVNDFLSRGRNEGLAPGRTIDRGRVLDAGETARRFPGVDREGLRGGALWHDAAMPDSQRLLIELLRWATHAGAVALNYVEAAELIVRSGNVTGIAAVDRATGERFELLASQVVNCAGPWCREVAERFDRDVPQLFPFSIAFNALLDREPPAETALAVKPRRPDGRIYFLHPWKDRVLAGTYHAAWTGSRAEGRVDQPMLADFLDDLNDAMPGFELRPEEVLRVHWGFLPAARAGSADLASREAIWDHGATGGPAGLFSVSGVKYTTARLVAEKTLRRLLAARGLEMPPPAAPRPEPVDWPTREELERPGGSPPEELARRVRDLASSEAVLHLDDLMLRRTDWGCDPRRAAELGATAAGLLGWKGDRTRDELSRLARQGG
jgi:glycerol-3-phosphate dehydrogenase